MVTGRQVRRLMQLMETGEKLMVAALKTGMDEKTARKCIRAVKPCVANPPADAYKGIAPPAVALDSDVTSSLKSNPKASAGSTKR